MVVVDFSGFVLLRHIQWNPGLPIMANDFGLWRVRSGKSVTIHVSKPGAARYSAIPMFFRDMHDCFKLHCRALNFKPE